MLNINLYGKVFGRFNFIRTIAMSDSLFTAIVKMDTFVGSNGLKEVNKFSTSGNFMADTYLFSNGEEEIMIRIENA